MNLSGSRWRRLQLYSEHVLLRDPLAKSVVYLKQKNNFVNDCNQKERKVMTEALHYLSIAEAAARIRAKRLSSIELTRAILDRIDALDGRLHSYITVLRKPALAEALKADKEIARGNYLGPMHGIPISIKDLIWTRGVRTTAHSRLLADWVPKEDATVVIQLRNAGAINLGKNTLTEFAYGVPGSGEAFPAARNPWNLDYAPGSSSSGSAAAVVAGLAMGAVGTDSGGSIRHPSAVCGAVGMKPTHGRVSKYGVIPVSSTLDHVGPITRNVRDNAIMLSVMSGYDPKDLCSVDAPVSDFTGKIKNGILKLRIGVPESLLKSLPIHSSVQKAFDAAKNLLIDLGAQLKHIDVLGAQDAHAYSGTVLAYEAYQYHRDNITRHPEKYSAPLIARIRSNMAVTEDAYAESLRERDRLCNAFARVFDNEVDLIITPGREEPAITMAEFCLASTEGRGLLTRIYNYTGLPALVMPMGFTCEGFPLSLQFVAREFAEDLIYQAAAAYEDATLWNKRQPQF